MLSDWIHFTKSFQTYQSAPIIQPIHLRNTVLFLDHTRTAVALLILKEVLHLFTSDYETCTTTVEIFITKGKPRDAEFAVSIDVRCNNKKKPEVYDFDNAHFAALYD